jgi:hypothetical protein
VDETDSLEHWQTIAKQLKARKAFAGESYFCTIDGLFQSNSETKIAPVKGQYVLGADKDFELRIFHYDPDADAHSGYKATRWLRLAAVEPGVQLRSTPLLAIDPPYDLKSVQIRTGSTLANQYSSLVLNDESRVDDPQKSAPHENTLQVFLPVKITGSVWRNAGLVLGLGILLTVQQLVSLYSKPDANPGGMIVVLTILLGMLTALVAVFGLRKSV